MPLAIYVFRIAFFVFPPFYFILSDHNLYLSVAVRFETESRWRHRRVQMKMEAGNVEFLAEGLSATADLFELIVQSELKAASTSSSAFNDDDSGIDIQACIFATDERLSSYGLIARASIERVLRASFFSPRLMKVKL